MHNIYQAKFASVREVAWHRLGIVFDRAVTAVEAWEAIGKYNVEKRELFYDGGISTNTFGICRVEDDGSVGTHFGIVKKGYRLVTPDDFVNAYALAADDRPIETLGCLGKGEAMFLTTPLRDIQIIGDEVQQYLLLCDNMDGQKANWAMITNVRVVCQNTLQAALGDFSGVYKINHNAAAITDTCKWIQVVLENATAKADAVKEAMEFMATHRVNGFEQEEALRVTVPIPTRPRQTGSFEVDQLREIEWDHQISKAHIERTLIGNLFAGDGVGMDTPACKGTAFGLWNAVAEAYDHILPGRNETTVAHSTMFGERSIAKQAAFNTLLKFSRN